MIDIIENTFLESFKLNIVDNNEEILRSILKDIQFKDQVQNYGMDLLSIICENIKEDMIDFNNREDVYCNLINFIAENGNPKEVICIFNYQLNKIDEDFKFLILLYPLSLVLQRLDLTVNSSKVIVKESLNCTLSYLKNLPVAHYKGLEGKELEVYIQASETQRIFRLSKTYLSFLEVMIINENFSMSKNDFKTELLRSLLILYDYGLIKLVFYLTGIVAEESRTCALRAFELVEQLVRCLHQAISNIHKNNSTLQQIIIDCADEDEKKDLASQIVPCSSLVCLLHHIFVVEKSKKYPQIYTPIYNWNFSATIVSQCLIDCADPHAVRLCLLVIDSFDNLIPLSSVKWNKDIHLTFFDSLKNAMISNFNREIRGLVYSTFRKSFDKIDVRGRYKLLRNLLKFAADHSGLKGQLILMLKTEILNVITARDQTSRKRDVVKTQDKYFTGSSVYQLIRDIFVLEDGEKIDVVNESEWILAALNLLYVVLLRDTDHFMGFDVLIEDFQNDFLRPLTKATELSFSHYRNEATVIERDEQSSTMTELSGDLSFMNKEQKLDFINKAILTIELVRCNLSRVTNLL